MPSLKDTLKILLFGALFGVLLTKSGVISWFAIRDMFHFREPDLFLIIGSAVATGALSLALIRKLGIRDARGGIPAVPRKRLGWGSLLGGTLFGAGWYVAGTCPGPIYAQLGSGEWLALATLAGAVLGAAFYSLVSSRLPG